MPSTSIYDFLKLSPGTPICSDNIIFLLGAGASIDAGIPALSGMMESFENDLENKPTNLKLVQLYHYFKRKSKLKQYSLNSSASIEDMLAIMEDFLHMHEEKSAMYDLVSSWDKDLIEIFQFDFKLIEELRDKLKNHVILKLCKKWDAESASQLNYFHFLFYLQKQLGGILKIFTLNHDCCIEEAYRYYHQKHKGNVGEGKEPPTLLETGFRDKILNQHYQPKAYFDIENFTNEGEYEKGEEKCLKLYKLHGSIDWEKVNERIKHTDTSKNSEVIFGISQKYKSEEPYSLLYPEFKKALTEGARTMPATSSIPGKEEDKSAKILVIVGYSFHDQHINDAIYAAMRKNEKLKILICDPGLVETHYFGLPQITENARCKNDFIKSIVRSEDYELYTNMSVILHSVYYSRNFDEDALFLTACIEDDLRTTSDAQKKREYIRYTAFAQEENDLSIGMAILKNILGPEKVPSKCLKDYFAGAKPTVSREARNKAIYGGKNPEDSRYNDVLDCIDAAKISIYNKQKKMDIEDRADRKESKPTNHEKAAALELIDDLRMIEKFIKEFIPVHLSLMFGLIEQYQNLSEGNEKTNLRMHVFEMYLKYNYLIDVIEIKLVKITKSNEPDSTTKAIHSILGREYCDTFCDLITERGKDEEGVSLREQLEKVNGFLKSIKNNFLVDGLDPSFQHSAITAIVNENNITEFQDVFLTWNKNIREEDIQADEGLKNLNRILYHRQDFEREINLKIMFYSKGLAKSMVDRFSHAERLLHDLENMISIIHRGSETIPKSTVEECFASIQNVTHFAPRYDYRTARGKYQQLLTLIDQDFWKSSPEAELDIEVNNKVPTNLNWYVNRFFKIQSELTDSLFMVKFSLPEKGLHFGKNLATYGRVFNRCRPEWTQLTAEMKRYGMDVFYHSENWKTIRNVFREDSGVCYLDRVSVCHFPAKIFFTKVLRGYTLYRSYFSVFYAEEHIRSFCDINRMIVSRRPK